ncbi:MAG TPA: sigma factor [Gemmataceae bacterium]|jgi:RNA polymerase sigma-70 factor (ECF subfamily)|nr:sigma factor [Gemmataceae bacterium]
MSTTPADRLSQISTMWTALVRAHGSEAEADHKLLAGLIERYQGAAYRYLAAATGDLDVAADLFQEFAVRFLRGDFRRASPERGRFRDYLRTTLINLSRRRPGVVRQGPSAGIDPDQLAAIDTEESVVADEAFLAHWRESLLDCAWKGLETAERGGGPPYFTALRLRADQPDIPSGDLAAELTTRLKPSEPFTDAGARKLLQRGREILTDLLVTEVAASVPTEDKERLAQELIDLGFFGYCRKALERWSP